MAEHVDSWQFSPASMVLFHAPLARVLSHLSSDKMQDTSLCLLSPDLGEVYRLFMEMYLLRIETDAPGSRPEAIFANVNSWYVVHCKTGKEKSTSETLKANLGLIAFLPEKRVWRKRAVCSIPLFPGYFFVRADLQLTSLSQINTSSGVLRLLKCDGAPQAVPAQLVEALYAELTRINEHFSASNQGFRPGDTLYVIEGPLHGLESVFIGPTTPSKRVQVFLHFLGRLTKAEVEVSALEKQPEHSKPVYARYTRGKGRKIRNQEIEQPGL